VLFNEKIRQQRVVTNIRYLQTQDAKGMQAYYFFIPALGKDHHLQHAAKDPGLYDLSEMGEILYSGFGKKPSKRDIQAIEKKLNIQIAKLFPQLNTY